MNLLEVKELHFSYPDGTVVFSGLNFAVQEHESVAIVGPNGSGKTSLINCLCGLLKTKKMVKLFGHYLDGKNVAGLRKNLSIVFQNPDDQLFMPTVFEDVAFGLINLGHKRAALSALVDEALGKVGLAGYEERQSHHLSYGEKKRVCLAAALARNSRLMLLDEPTNEFDPGARREFIRLIKKIKQTRIIVCHDLDLAAETCRTVIVLNHGVIVASGRSRKILSDKKLMEENSLEVPYRYR